MTAAATLNDGEHGLTDGSSEGDWRLPTKAEWQAFYDTNYSDPPLCNEAGTAQWTQGDAFIDVLSGLYWSSTEYNSLKAWFAGMNGGVMGHYNKGMWLYVWPVRSDN